MEGIFAAAITKLTLASNKLATLNGWGQVVSNCAGGGGLGDLEGDQDGIDLMSQLMEEVR